MYLVHLWPLVLSALLVSATSPTRTRPAKRQVPTPGQFVNTQGVNFVLDGVPLDFVGTNAYWLASLNSEEDIDATLGNISAAGITVVRTWAFNDVDTIPENGTWFQLIQNGTTMLNEGPNGLQKLDTVVRLAEKHGLFLLLTLTNNWNPHPVFDAQVNGLQARQLPSDPSNSNFSAPRNTLSNDYGGMDIYVRQFGAPPMHDEFYTNTVILDAFMNYTTQIVSRYANSSAVFAWELANDPRCNSTLPSNNGCQTTTVTQWHSTVAQHVKTVDPNHLVTSGNQGFVCPDCPKLFPRVEPPPPPPPPQPSPAPGARRRRAPQLLTKARMLMQRKAIQKKVRALTPRQTSGGVRIRGRWVSTETKRQDDQGLGSLMDGSQGVDSEDIINIPQIGFGTFQLFPDQNTYGPTDPTLPKFNNTVNQGIAWIQAHAAMGALFNKPVTLNGFGLVTQNNAPAFVPFNDTAPIFVPNPDNSTTTTDQLAGFVTDDQRDDAYAQWLQAGLQAGLQGMMQYQWSQANLTAVAGTAVSPIVTGTGLDPLVPGTGLSPNDGYGIQGVGQQQVVDTISSAAAAFAPDAAPPSA